MKDEKVCKVCKKPFTWRKKWKKDWEQVLYCSERGRRYKNKVKFSRKKGLPSLPVTLAEEKQTNPFLRSHKPNLARAVSKHRGVKSNQPSDIFAALREWKDSF